MSKFKSKIVGLETLLESVFGLDGSEFGWQHIPDSWSSSMYFDLKDDFSW